MLALIMSSTVRSVVCLGYNLGTLYVDGAHKCCGSQVRMGDGVSLKIWVNWTKKVISYRIVFQEIYLRNITLIQNI